MLPSQSSGLTRRGYTVQGSDGQPVIYVHSDDVALIEAERDRYREALDRIASPTLVAGLNVPMARRIAHGALDGKGVNQTVSEPRTHEHHTRDDLFLAFLIGIYLAGDGPEVDDQHELLKVYGPAWREEFDSRCPA